MSEVGNGGDIQFYGLDRLPALYTPLIPYLPKFYETHRVDLILVVRRFEQHKAEVDRILQLLVAPHGSVESDVGEFAVELYFWVKKK